MFREGHMMRILAIFRELSTSFPRVFTLCNEYPFWKIIFRKQKKKSRLRKYSEQFTNYVALYQLLTILIQTGNTILKDQET